MKIYTRRGDGGETNLLYGGRVSKDDLRCEAYGTLDEANGALGLGKALSRNDKLREIVAKLQRELFTVGAELATAPDQYANLEKHFGVVTPEMVRHLEETADELGRQISLPRAFILPGATPAAAALDMARSIIRRAERRVVSLKKDGLVSNDEVLKYLNRLSSLLFVLARYEERFSGDGPG